jgi:hypothetical protein
MHKVTLTGYLYLLNQAMAAQNFSPTLAPVFLLGTFNSKLSKHLITGIDINRFMVGFFRFEN